MIVEMWKDMTFEEIHELHNTLKESGEDLDKRLTHLIANKVLCVKNGVYFRVKQLRYVDDPIRNVRRYSLVIDTLEDISNNDIHELGKLPLKELLPIKSGRKVRAQ